MDPIEGHLGNVLHNPASNVTTIFEDKASPRDHAQMILVTRSPHNNSHPFAALHELNQKGILQLLAYHDLGLREQYWAARISVSCRVLGIESLHFDGLGGSKQDAKRRAAECALERLTQSSPYRIDTEQLLRDTSPNNASDRIHSSQDIPLFTKKQNQALSIARKHLQLARRLGVQTQTTSNLETILIAIDLEWHETGHHELLEIGLCLTAWPQCSETLPELTTHHLVIQEQYGLRNGTYVPDHKDDFNFGNSEVIAYGNLCGRISEILGSFALGSYKIVLVGHSIAHDLSILEQVGMTDIVDHNAVDVLDIALAYQAQQKQRQTTRLSKILDHYDIPYSNLHNAANDAYYTLLACHQIAMAK